MSRGESLWKKEKKNEASLWKKDKKNERKEREREKKNPKTSVPRTVTGSSVHEMPFGPA